MDLEFTALDVTPRSAWTSPGWSTGGKMEPSAWSLCPRTGFDREALDGSSAARDKSRCRIRE